MSLSLKWYLADQEQVLEDGSVDFHHHDVLVYVGIEEFLGLHLASLNNHDDLLLDLVKSGSLRCEGNCVTTWAVNEEVCLIVVAPELL